MARNDVYLYTNATSPADAVITAQQNTTAADFPELVLGDSPTFNFYFTDGSASWPSFAGNAQYSVEWTLGSAGSDDSVILAHQTTATVITGGWSMVLPLNTGAIINQLNNARISQAYPVIQLWQQIRVTDPSGYKTTYANIRTNLRLRTAPSGQVLPDDPLPSGYLNVIATQAGALASPANFFTKCESIGSSAANLLLNGNGVVGYVGADGVKATEFDALYIITPTITHAIGRGVDVKTTWSGSYGATGINSYFYTTGATTPDHVHNFQSHLFHEGTYTLPLGTGYWAFLENDAGTGGWTMGAGFYYAGHNGTIANVYAFYSAGTDPSSFGGKVTARSGLALSGSNSQLLEINRASTSDSSIVQFQTGAANKWAIGTGLTEISELWSLYNYTTAANVFSVNPANSNVTFAATVTAPFVAASTYLLTTLVTSSTGEALTFRSNGGASECMSFTSAGAATIPNGLTLQGGAVTYGANDSAGAGYRLVRVPNA